MPSPKGGAAAWRRLAASTHTERTSDQMCILPATLQSHSLIVSYVRRQAIQGFGPAQGQSSAWMKIPIEHIAELCRAGRQEPQPSPAACVLPARSRTRDLGLDQLTAVHRAIPVRRARHRHRKYVSRPSLARSPRVCLGSLPKLRSARSGLWGPPRSAAEARPAPKTRAPGCFTSWQPGTCFQGFGLKPMEVAMVGAKLVRAATFQP